ncbi:MAG: hypothetical protein IKH16_04225, partial [Selenomonadaceae bacterium]|nr:hypothetical protein [Selenomonadaceae bacterium]
CKVYGYKGNDTLYGGSDSDIFYYGTGDGKDTIRNFQSGDDLVRFYKGSVTSFKSSGKNVVLGTSGQGSITLAAMAGKRIDVMDAKGAKTAYWVGKQTTANKLTGADTASVLVGGAKKDILKAGKGNSKLYGQDGNDTLTGGAGKDYLDGGKGNDSLFGGSGNDTLFGGAGNDILRGGRGNDTLNGGAGRDIFLYANGDGKDVIETYTDAQAIKILSGRISSMKASKKHYHSDKGYVQDVVLTIGNGSVTLKDVSPQSSFNVIYASGNTKSYTVSSLKTK